jgi:hypothetical protein
MAFDYSKLRGKIYERFGNQKAFAKAMGMTSATLSKKLSNKIDWRRTEITTACGLLGIPIEEVPLYFFTH